jgi:hypothetical protein
MTPEGPDRDEAELRSLFESTREAPDGVQLTKLRARAVDVPLRAQRRPWWLVWAPLAAVAAGALVIVVARSGGTPELAVGGGETAATSEQSAVPTAVAKSTTPAPSPSAPPAPAPGEEDETSDPELDSPEDELAGLNDYEPNSNDIFAALDEPAEEDVDAWLAATSAFLEDG